MLILSNLCSLGQLGVGGWGDDFVSNKVFDQRSSAAGFTMTTPVPPIILILTFFFSHTHIFLAFVLFLLGKKDWSRQRGAEDEAEKRGLRSRGKREKKEGAELNLQVWLLGHLLVSPCCPLPYLSTCSLSLFLFLSFPWSATGQSLVGDGFPVCLATHVCLYDGQSFFFLPLVIFLPFLHQISPLPSRIRIRGLAMWNSVLLF